MNFRRPALIRAAWQQAAVAHVFLILAFCNLAGPGLAQTTATLATSPTAATTTATPPAGDPPLVYVIPVEGEFENALHLIVVRAIRQAERAGADAIVLDMDTPGGRVDSAIKIRDALIRTKIPTYTFVNPMAISAGSFIAMATDKIIMGPNGSIGGALPITVSGGEARGADEKFQSVFNAEMRKTAKTKGHPEDIAEGFCNPKIVIPGLKKEGEILTLDWDQATSVGLSPYQAQSLQEMLEREGMGRARVERFHLTNTDRIARFLSSSAVLGILMMIGIAGIFLELKTPGIGLPGAIGGGAILLCFAGSYLANLSGYMEWIIFVIGVILLVLEIYVIPGFGVAGIAGITMIVGSLFFTMINIAPGGDLGLSFSGVRLEMIARAGMVVILAMLGLIPFLYILGRLLPSTTLYHGLVLTPQQAGAKMETTTLAGGTSQTEAALTEGMRGQALTDLHPTGTGRFAGRRVDVLTEGEYIKKGATIQIARIEGTQIIVQEA